MLLCLVSTKPLNRDRGAGVVMWGEPMKYGKNTELQRTCAGKAKPFILMGTHWRPTGCYEFQLCRSKSVGCWEMLDGKSDFALICLNSCVSLL